MSKSKVLVAVAAAAIAFSAHSQRIVGQWDFNDNLNPTTGTETIIGGGNIIFENTTINGQAAKVARFGDDGGDGNATITVGHSSYFQVPNACGPNGGSLDYTNQFTLIMDVFFADPGVVGNYVSLFQTNAAPNGNDGDAFINPDNGGGIGISGDYDDAGNALRFTTGAWHRVTLSLDCTTPIGNAEYKVYIDGVLQNQVKSPGGWGLDGRYSMYTTTTGAPDFSFFLFGDDSGDSREGLINSFQLRDYAMTASEVAALGGPTASGIPASVPATTVTGVVALDPTGCELEGEQATISVVGGETQKVHLGPGGTFSARLFGIGTGAIKVKLRGTLAKRVNGVVFDGTTKDVGTVTLKGTDSTCDGKVDDFDLAAVIFHFGSISD